jgi:hypothetical protein
MHVGSGFGRACQTKTHPATQISDSESQSTCRTTLISTLDSFLSCIYQSYHKLVPSHFCCLPILNFSFAPLLSSTTSDARTRLSSPKCLALLSVVPLALGPLLPPRPVSPNWRPSCTTMVYPLSRASCSHGPFVGGAVRSRRGVPHGQRA